MCGRGFAGLRLRAVPRERPPHAAELFTRRARRLELGELGRGHGIEHREHGFAVGSGLPRRCRRSERLERRTGRFRSAGAARSRLGLGCSRLGGRGVVAAVERLVAGVGRWTAGVDRRRGRGCARATDLTSVRAQEHARADHPRPTASTRLAAQAMTCTGAGAARRRPRRRGGAGSRTKCGMVRGGARRASSAVVRSRSAAMPSRVAWQEGQTARWLSISTHCVLLSPWSR